MKYTVVWLPAAEQELAALWLDPATRADVTDASNRIDHMLRRDPNRWGESRPDGQRILFVAPLGVLFRIKPDDCLVEIVHVWMFA